MLEVLLKENGVDGFAWFIQAADDWHQGTGKNAQMVGRGPVRLKVYEVVYVWREGFRNDPVVREIPVRDTPFSSEEIYSRPLTKEERDMVNLAHRFGLYHDLTIPVNLPNHIQAMSFFILGKQEERVVHFKSLAEDLEKIALLFCMLARPMQSKNSVPGGILELTNREHECLALVARGDTNTEIAAHLHISERTVKYHVSNLLRKFNTGSRAQLIAAAAKLNMLSN